MRIVILGLSLSSSWGNGHATTWRALIRAMAPEHEVLFLERDVPWYAANRDLPNPDFCRFALYDGVEALEAWQEEIATADAVIIGSFVTDGIEVAERVAAMREGALCFYDIDTPVTLAAIERGDCAYLNRRTIPLFDIYFSFTGGPTLRRLEQEFGAPQAVALYCGVDPARYYPVEVEKRWVLGYLGTYSPDRQPALERLLIEPARLMPERRFVVAGAQFPDDIEWPANVERIEHVPPERHREFYAAQAWTLNVTRADMRAAGYSPSVRLFEATACGTPVISDDWDGIHDFFRLREGLIVVQEAEDVAACLALPEAERLSIAQAGLRRTLAEHTAAHRAETLVAAIRQATPPRAARPRAARRQAQFTADQEMEGKRA
ncbi:MAG TPA: glycosyltransferase [Acetobacteraceae bacterium]|nr:glycosyltransferase [Acetobacteraceae bacterium]